MADTDQAADHLLVAVQDRMAIVQVHGRGTFKVSGALKDFGRAAIAEHNAHIVLDMRHCVGMDSTFMGVLAGLALHLERCDQPRLALINLSERTHGLLVTLGLDQLVDSHMSGGTPEQFAAIDECADLASAKPGAPSRQETAETMLEAHEDLVRVSPENYPKFKDVLTFLREDLEGACRDEKDRSSGEPAE